MRFEKGRGSATNYSGRYNFNKLAEISVRGEVNLWARVGNVKLGGTRGSDALNRLIYDNGFP